MCLLSACLLLPAAVQAEPPAMASELSPQQALQRMQVPEGFAVDLIAAEPDVVQPIAMCFDAKGRLWVAEGMTYPQRAPEGQGQDRLLIFEDQDGDGTFETRKVFAEGLNLVSGFEIGFGGVFVGAPPFLLFLADADGDDRPDSEPQVLLDGWGYQDTHETLNSFVWGPDGWLWGCHGVFTHSLVGKPGAPAAERIPLNAGVWRYHPVRRVFEVVAHGTSNPWGLDFNDWGDAFVEACVISHLWHVIPGGFYERQAGSHFNPHIYQPLSTIADHRHWTGDIAAHAHWGHEDGISREVSDAGGGHAHSGFVICLSDSFPAEFRNSALFFNIHGHRLNRDRLTRGGSGWIGSHAPDVLHTYDDWFLGVSIRSGPDGALYFCDWQDATSCHRPDPLRWDRSNGRLYRLRHGALTPWKGNLAAASDRELAECQAGRNEWQLRTARTVLQARAASGRPLDPAALAALRHTLQEHPDITRRLRALWALAACGAVAEREWIELLRHPEPALRTWAVRLCLDHQPLTAALRLALTERAREEPAAPVQLALCSLLQTIPADAALDLAAALAPRLDPRDANLIPMLWFGLERCVAGDLPRSLQLASTSPDPRLLRWVARRAEEDQALDPLFAFLESSPEPPTGLLEGLLDRIRDKPAPSLRPRHLRVLAALAGKGDILALELAARAGHPPSLAAFWQRVQDPQTPAEQRRGHLNILAAAASADPSPWEALLQDPALRLDAIALRPSLLRHPVIAEMIPGLSAEELARLARTSLQANQPEILLHWLQSGLLTPKQIPADVVSRLREIREEPLQGQIAQLWSERIQAETAIRHWQETLHPEALRQADLPNGRRLFDQTCAACHKLFGEGADIGPELTGGERFNLRHWLDNILDPNALIGQGYELHQITTRDGTEIVGMLAAETDRELTLRMIGTETKVPVADIRQRQALGRSMMPEGLLDALSETEVRDLIGYLMSPRQVGR